MDTTKLTPAQIQALRFTDEKTWANHMLREPRGKIVAPVYFKADDPSWANVGTMQATVKVWFLGDRVVETEVVDGQDQICAVTTFTPSPPNIGLSLEKGGSRE